jgi:hypothetical protein
MSPGTQSIRLNRSSTAVNRILKSSPSGTEAGAMVAADVCVDIDGCIDIDDCLDIDVCVDEETDANVPWSIATVVHSGQYEATENFFRTSTTESTGNANPQLATVSVPSSCNAMGPDCVCA